MDRAAFPTTEQQVKENRRLLSRRDLLKCGALAGAGLVAAPMFNRGRYRIFANSPVEYTSRAIDLVQQSLVIDMLGPFTLDFAKGNRWLANPESFKIPASTFFTWRPDSQRQTCNLEVSWESRACA